MDDLHYSKFISSLAECMQSFCSRYMPFQQQVLLTGQLYLSVDFHGSKDFVIDEKLFVSAERQVVHSSNSYINSQALQQKNTSVRGYGDYSYVNTVAGYGGADTSQRAFQTSQTDNRWPGVGSVNPSMCADTRTSVGGVNLSMCADTRTSVGGVNPSMCADTNKYVGKVRTLESGFLNSSCDLVRKDTSVNVQSNIPVNVVSEAIQLGSNTSGNVQSNIPEGVVADTTQLGNNISNLEYLKNACTLALANEDSNTEIASMSSESDPVKDSRPPDAVKYVGKIRTLNFNPANLDTAIVQCKELEKQKLIDSLRDNEAEEENFGFLYGEERKNQPSLNLSDQGHGARARKKRDSKEAGVESENENNTDHSTQKSGKDKRNHIDPNKRFKCYYCDKTFRYKHLRHHEKLVHEEKKYKCCFCRKIFKNQKSGKQHERTSHIRNLDERKFKCGTCGKQFLYSYHLTKHEVVHSGVRAFTCELCGKSFFFKGTLNAHYATHSADKPHKCETCGKCFKQTQHLRKHKRQQHSGIVESFKCEKCGKSFKESSSLKRHDLVVHVGVAPVPCDLCGKGFTTRYHVNRHKIKSCPKSHDFDPGPPLFEVHQTDLRF